MEKNLINLFDIKTIYDDKITEILSSYIEKIINDDKTVTYINKPTKYFLENNNWDISFFTSINQFKYIEDKNVKINFIAKSNELNKELKFIVYNKIFSEEWGLKSIHFHATNIKRICQFLNIKYPNLNSFKQVNSKKICLEWINWLYENNINIYQNIGNIFGIKDKDKQILNTTAKYMEIVVEYFLKLIDDRSEWEKDKWDVRNLNKEYDIKYSKTNGSYYIDFEKIENTKIRIAVKK